MVECNNLYEVQPNLMNLGSVMTEMKIFFKTMIRESIEEVLGDQLSLMTLRSKTITSDELCERWSCSKNTLRNKELDRLINPISVNGKTKVYSMGDVLDLELSGVVKKVS